MKKSIFKILTYKNYLKTIKNSENAKMFQSVFVLDNAKERDILRKGELSCAYYVSSILKLFDLISCQHATVKSTIEDMKENNWKETKKMKPGNVLVWEEKEFKNNEKHFHIGFYLGNKIAISNSEKKKVISAHHYTYGTENKKPVRKIINIFTHDKIK